MKSFIHPSSVVDPKAQIGENNFIGPFCYIGPNVKIGNNNRFETSVVIGTPAEHRDFFQKPPGPVEIGNENVFREFSRVHGAALDKTVIANKCTLLAFFAHCARLKN